MPRFAWDYCSDPQSLSIKANYRLIYIKASRSKFPFTQDITCVTYPLLPEAMHLLQVQPGRGRTTRSV